MTGSLTVSRLASLLTAFFLAPVLAGTGLYALLNTSMGEGRLMAMKSLNDKVCGRRHVGV